MTHLHVKVSPDFAERLVAAWEAEAQRTEGLTFSQWVRQTLAEAIRKGGKRDAH